MAPSSRRSAALAAGVLALAVANLAAFQRSVFFETWNDENVHLYVAQRVSEGAVLYRDVRSARPPLAVLPLSLPLAAGAGPLAAARGLSFATHLAIAAVLLFAGRRWFGLVAGVAGAALYLSAAHVLSRQTYTGIQLVALGVLVCAVLTLLERPLAAGVAAGLALATGQHAAVVVGLCGLWTLRQGLRRAGRFAGGAAAALGVVFGLVWAVGGTGVFEDLVGKHLYHVAGGDGAQSEIGWWIGLFALDDLGLLALALLAGLAPRQPKATRWGPARLCLVAALTHVLVVAVMQGGLALYLFPPVPLLALAAGEGVRRGLSWVQARVSSAGRGRLTALGALLGLAALVVAGWAGARSMQSRRDSEPYPLVPVQRYAAMAHVQRLVTLDALARLAQELPEGETVFGFPTLMGPVALRSGRRVSADLADLAPRWFRTGSVSRAEVIDAVEKDRVGMLATPPFAFAKDPGFRPWLERCFLPPLELGRPRGEGRGIPRILVYRHRPERPCR